MIKNILVVCVGNICRSPMAEGLLRKALPDCKLSSAGLGALVGQPADSIAIELMHAWDVDITAHRAQQLQASMMIDSNLVLVMQLDQQRHLEQQYPLARGKIFRLCDISKSDVADPYRHGRNAFEEACGLIVQGVESWVPRISKLMAAHRSTAR